MTGNKKRIIIIGATSGIGREVAKRYIRKGWQLGIAGRNEEALQEMQKMSPQQIEICRLDITQPDAPERLKELIGKTGGMDLYFHSSGIGSQNKKLEPEIELNTVRTNAEGFVRMVTAAYAYFQAQGQGHLAVISSVAGTKGLGLAPAYSATKSFQNIYIQSLAQLVRLEKEKIILTDIRPGFVETPLLKNDSYPLMMKPEQVAEKIEKALDRKKRIAIIDWRYSILVFFWKLIPGWLWERLPIDMRKKQ